MLPNAVLLCSLRCMPRCCKQCILNISYTPPAQSEICSQDNKTAFDWALDAGNTAVAELLKELMRGRCRESAGEAAASSQDSPPQGAPGPQLLSGLLASAAARPSGLYELPPGAEKFV